MLMSVCSKELQSQETLLDGQRIGKKKSTKNDDDVSC